MTGGAARRVGSVAEVRAGRGRTRCAQRAQLRTDAHSADPSTRCSQLLRAGTWCPPRRPPRYGVYCSPRTQALPSAPRSVEAADLRAAQLEEALLSRDVIGQAEGMLMAQRRPGVRGPSHRLPISERQAGQDRRDNRYPPGRALTPGGRPGPIARPSRVGRPLGGGAANSLRSRLRRGGSVRRLTGP